ncbi:MAG: adenosylcobinamide-GDP ribazoletransferase [Bdellovibrionia bacterium]
MNSFFAAWQFLTIFPIPKLVKVQIDDLERSPAFYPLVGLVLGFIVAILDLGLCFLFPLNIASALLVITLMAVSGGLHADGLADTADGFLSSRPRERILEIMRDSRSGPMAVIVLVSVFAVKWAALTELAGPRFWKLILLLSLSRWNVLLSMNINSYARLNGGLANVFIRRDSKKSLWITGGLIAICALAYAGVEGVTIFAINIGFAFLFSYYCRKKIGGFTGDTLGAACELSEVSVLLTTVLIDRMHQL